MFLERLELTDFRNYESLRLDFQAPLALFVGRNAQGKTNILEAVLLLALARSPRTARDGELVRWGCSTAVVRGEVRRTQRPPVAVSVGLAATGQKTVKVDGVARRRLVDALGEVNVVMFGPDDLRLVSGGPGERRAFLNTCLGQISHRYLGALATYRNVLRQRNALLRAGRQRGVDPVLREAYDEQLAAAAAVLMQERAWRVAELEREAAAVHHDLAGGGERLAARYEPNVPWPDSADEATLAGALREVLASRRAEEQRRGVTVAGPHRDELVLTINGAAAKVYGSQGQQRTAALALKIAELRVVAAAVGEPPLLLLDDVLSELDARRRAAVLELVGEADQVLLSGADEQLVSAGPHQAEIYHVRAGQVRAARAS